MNAKKSEASLTSAPPQEGCSAHATITRMNPPAQDAAARTDLAARIDAALPQTQCGRCGWPDCAAYARAIAGGQAAINQCPPGGAEGVRRLAAITGLPSAPLNPDNGLEAPREVALIDEDWCIGCTLCIKACPTDAILGLNKRMHTIIAEHCTGCALCIPACPVDCIAMINASGTLTGWAAWSPQLATAALQRYQQRQARLQTPEAAVRVNAPTTATAATDETQTRDTPPAAAALPQPEPSNALPTRSLASADDTGDNGKSAVIAAALARARALRQPAP